MNLKKIAIAAALASTAFGANASTLLMEFSGATVYNFDATHSASYAADLTAITQEDAKYSTFEGWLVINNYENYLTGTHTIAFGGNVASDTVSFSLFSGLVNGVEGTNATPTMPNPSYVEGVANCTTRGGCDFDGDGVIETPRNNNPATVSGGYSTLPNNTTWGTGSVTLVNGKVFSLEYETVASAGTLQAYDSPAYAREAGNAADAINNAVLASKGWDTRIESIDVLVNSTTSARLVSGDATLADAVYVANGLNGVANVNMTMAVPEPETYAMLLSGLGLIGMAARRRMKSAA
ncbi:MAG: PEP-CTERM sorting domain-containing protein [Methyloversatilis sp.]|jgi:hypothetical protein|nr:PEP-CTERM sorting domain-containing protein [Methyloversatilis sp.]